MHMSEKSKFKTRRLDINTAFAVILTRYSDEILLFRHKKSGAATRINLNYQRNIDSYNINIILASKLPIK